MRSLSDAQGLVRERLKRNLHAWAALTPIEAAALTVHIALQPPTEAQARIDEAGTAAWAREWARFAEQLPDGIVLHWAIRNWHRLGAQRIPTALDLNGRAVIGAFAGDSLQRSLKVLVERDSALRGLLDGFSGAGLAPTQALPPDHERRHHDQPEVDQPRPGAGDDSVTAALRRVGSSVLALGHDDFGRLREVVAWLLEHPSEALRPRQLPVRGVDTKWFGRHRGTVAKLVEVAHPGPLPIVDADPRIRLRVLDGAVLHAGAAGTGTGAGTVDGVAFSMMPHDLAAPPAELARLPLHPRVAFVFENLESVLAMPDWPGTVAVHGGGYAVDLLEQLPWLHQTPIVYWGDLDSHGLAILNRLRAHLPHARSVLMDVDTLLAHRDLWVPEPAPSTATLEHLTEAERQALHALHDEGSVRLEQERIPWAYALQALRAAVDETVDASSAVLKASAPQTL
jgi:hypothetical protein